MQNAGGPHHADDPLARALELGGRLRPGFVRRHHRPRDLLEIAGGIDEDLGHPLDQLGRRRIGNEIAGQLGGEVRGGRRMRGQVPQHAASLFHRFVLVELSDHLLRAGLVQTGIEREFAAVLGIIGRRQQRPSGDHLGEA